jgi:diguanylate cyclase (GGDEF)-like protein/hemerythrin-like metal-binding protein/PAS domain S-box-containing protein
MSAESGELPVFVWDARYETGIEMVDTQHKRLVSLINALGELYARSGSETLLIRVFEALGAYTVYHFREEEGLMARHGIDAEHETAHKAIHENFGTQVLVALEKARQAPMQVAGELLPFLTKWLIFHILGTDQRMAAEIHAREAGASPEHAREIAEQSMTESNTVLLGAFNQMYENLSARTHAYWDTAHRLKSEIAERKRAESELADRLRELSCLSDLAVLTESCHPKLEKTLAAIVNLLPKAWGSSVGVRLHCTTGKFSSWAEQPAELLAKINLTVDESAYGQLAVFSLGEKPVAEPAASDLTLLQTFGERIASYVERCQAQDARRKLSMAVDQSPVSIIITNRQGVIEYANLYFTTLTGYSLQEVVGQKPNLLKSGHTSADGYRDLWTTILRGDTWAGEFYNRKKNGDLYWESAHISPIAGDDGEITHFLAVKQDITERKTAERHLQDSHSRLSSSLEVLQDHAREMQVISRMTDLIQTCMVQEEACRVVEDAAGDLFRGLGGSLALRSAHEGCLETVATWGQKYGAECLFTYDDCWGMRRGHPHDVEAGNRSARCRHIIDKENAAYLCLPMNVVGEALGLVTLKRPASDAEWSLGDWRQLAVSFAESIKMSISNLKLREALREQAIRDPLTSLYNRRYLENVLPRELNRSVRAQRPMSIVMVDIDHFKRFNDTYGHKAGDLVLQAVARTMQESLRNSDLACRYGGEEFVLLLAEMDGETAVRRMERLLEQVSLLTIESEGLGLPTITFSAGIASCPLHAVQQEQLLGLADAAMYSAKNGGRNQVMLYGAPMLKLAQVAAQG